MTAIRQLQRVTTGIPGLDFILAGGLFETGVYILQGGAGSGKTTVANQICFHQARQQRRAIYYTLLTESHDRMLAFLQHMTFFDASLVPNGVSYVSGFKLLESEGLPGVTRSIRDIVSAQRPTLFVVDGLVTAEEIAPSDTAFKKFLHEIQTIATMFRCTVLLLTNTESASRLHAEHTMVDGILSLCSVGPAPKTQRAIEVMKLRGAGQQRGLHTFEISNDGISIQPRIETLLAPTGRWPRQIERKLLKFGIPELDAAIGGGVLTASHTMLLGASGTGKTVLGMHLLSEGAAAGETGLWFTFYEHPEELSSKARKFGLHPFADAVERGDIKVVWQSSVEANLDRMGAELIAAFDEVEPARVFIDGIHGFQVTVDDPVRIQDFFAALQDYFSAHQATVVFSAETRDLIGERAIHPPFPNASRLCQNILLTRFAELRGRMTRLFSVLKMRDSDFDPRVLELTIGDKGIQVVGTVEDADMMLGGQPRRILDPAKG